MHLIDKKASMYVIAVGKLTENDSKSCSIFNGLCCTLRTSNENPKAAKLLECKPG
jgi:hypothetical protein